MSYNPLQVGFGSNQNFAKVSYFFEFLKIVMLINIKVRKKEERRTILDTNLRV